jgi:hypothetical protein
MGVAPFLMLDDDEAFARALATCAPSGVVRLHRQPRQPLRGFALAVILGLASGMLGCGGKSAGVDDAGSQDASGLDMGSADTAPGDASAEVEGVDAGEAGPDVIECLEAGPYLQVDRCHGVKCPTESYFCVDYADAGPNQNYCGTVPDCLGCTGSCDCVRAHGYATCQCTEMGGGIMVYCP